VQCFAGIVPAIMGLLICISRVCLGNKRFAWMLVNPLDIVKIFGENKGKMKNNCA